MSAAKLWFKEVKRILKPGGINIFTVRHIGDEDYKNGKHIGEDMYQNDGFIFETLFWSWLARIIHVVEGIMWIGLIWYFNFVQIPNVNVDADDPLLKTASPHSNELDCHNNQNV